MKITMIVAKMEDGEGPLILGAWDEETISRNKQQFRDSLQRYRATMPGTDIRTAEVEVPDGFLESIWKPVFVQGKPVQS